MIRNYLVASLAAIGLISAIFLSVKMATPVPATPLVVSPVKNPFKDSLSAAGIIEAVNDHVAIGPSAPGVITHIYKSVGQTVSKGEPLLCLDTRELCAEEEIQQAKVEAAQIRLAYVQDQLNRLKSVQDPRAISQNELKTKEFEILAASSELKAALAELHWIQIRIEKMTLLAPQKGVIIQRKAKVGEYLAVEGKESSFIIGDLSQLQIRADIDEQNASLFAPKGQAFAFPKNNPDKSIPLQFVRIEPYVIPKKSLTGLGEEKVDTRVLQVIYTLEVPTDFTLYVGQQVDVFIDRER